MVSTSCTVLLACPLLRSGYPLCLRTAYLPPPSRTCISTHISILRMSLLASLRTTADTPGMVLGMARTNFLRLSTTTTFSCSSTRLWRADSLQSLPPLFLIDPKMSSIHAGRGRRSGWAWREAVNMEDRVRGSMALVWGRCFWMLSVDVAGGCEWMLLDVVGY